MLKAKRRRRQDTKHAVYMLKNMVTGDFYIGITVCGAAPKRAVKVRFQKHVRRAVTENRVWNLCKSIRSYGAENFMVEIVEVLRGRKPAHARERELIAELAPALNQY